MLREIHAAYTIAANLRSDRPVERAAWEPLRGIVELPLGPDEEPDEITPSIAMPDLPGSALVPWIPVDPTTLNGQREALAAVIGTWLAIGAVRPAIAWGRSGQGDDPTMALGVSTLFGGLVLQLLLAIAGQAGIAMCSACGQPFVPHRRLPSGRFAEPPRAYCPGCRAKHAPQNAAAKRWRDKNPDYFHKRRAERPWPDRAPKGSLA